VVSGQLLAALAAIQAATLEDLGFSTEAVRLTVVHPNGRVSGLKSAEGGLPL